MLLLEAVTSHVAGLTTTSNCLERTWGFAVGGRGWRLEETLANYLLRTDKEVTEESEYPHRASFHRLHTLILI